MTTGEFFVNLALSIIVVYFWTAACAFAVGFTGAAMLKVGGIVEAYRKFRESRRAAKARATAVADDAVALQREIEAKRRQIVDAAGRGLFAGDGRKVFERLALIIDGRDAPVFCTFPAGFQVVSIPTDGGDSLELVRTEECILDDGTDRLAVVYRQTPG